MKEVKAVGSKGVCPVGVVHKIRRKPLHTRVGYIRFEKVSVLNSCYRRVTRSFNDSENRRSWLPVTTFRRFLRPSHEDLYKALGFEPTFGWSPVILDHDHGISLHHALSRFLRELWPRSL